ncbi:MAG: hypothetical protein LBK13_13540 [Spirochaetales bacterium]|jgi:hypothetical protein|nr:hypothetical protein [Spirochaetales bacterium]
MRKNKKFSPENLDTYFDRLNVILNLLSRPGVFQYMNPVIFLTGIISDIEKLTAVHGFRKWRGRNGAG